MSKNNTTTEFANACATLIQSLAANAPEIKEGTRRKAIAPDEAIRNMVAAICHNYGLSYDNVIGNMRAAIVGTSQGYQRVETESAQAEFDAIVARLDAIRSAKSVYKQTKVLPEGFDVADFMTEADLVDRRDSLKKLLTRRKTEAAKAAKAAA